MHSTNSQICSGVTKLFMHSYKCQICSGVTKLCHYALIQILDLQWCYKTLSLCTHTNLRFAVWICSGVTKLCHYALIQISDLQWCYKTLSLCTHTNLRFAVVLQNFVIMHSYKSQICSGTTKFCHYAPIQILDLQWCCESVSKIYMGR